MRHQRFQSGVNNILCLSHDRIEVCLIPEALRINLLEVLGSGGPGGKPAAVRHNLETADGCVVSRGRGERLPDGLAGDRTPTLDRLMAWGIRSGRLLHGLTGGRDNGISGGLPMLAGAILKGVNNRRSMASRPDFRMGASLLNWRRRRLHIAKIATPVLDSCGPPTPLTRTLTRANTAAKLKRG